MKLLAISFISLILTACGGGSSTTSSVPIPSNVVISLNKSFTPLVNTISTSEGAPYGDTDFWLLNDFVTGNYGYGPTMLQRTYICLTGEVKHDTCGNYSNNNQPLTTKMLTDIDNNLSRFDNSGKKLVIRFMYNFGPIGPLAQDAPINVILTHLDQLAPILIKHQDIIFALEAGFIGTWGEWHHSTNNNDTSINRKLLLDKELSYFKGRFPILVRYPNLLIEYLGSTIASKDFGLHDDYYLSDAVDGGTWANYNSTNTYPITLIQKFTVDTSLTTMFVAEFGDLDSTQQTCQNIDQISKRYNLQSLTLGIYPSTVGSNLISQGCMSSFLNKVGTRIELNQATISGNSTQGSVINVSLTLSNTGYGRVIRQRPSNLVLLDRNNIITTIPITITQLDLRTLSNSYPTKTFTFQVTLPVDVTKYAFTKTLNVALSIPDPVPSLINQAAYMLPLNSLDNNNSQVFDISTGFNLIGTF